MNQKTGTKKNTIPIENKAEGELLGVRIREIRTQKGLTLKKLSDQSKLNINTLSMIEKGKTSPSIGTLQRLARALDVPVISFFDSSDLSSKIVFTAHNNRPETTCCHALIQNLGKDLKDNAIEPFIITMPKDAGSGGRTLVHTGFEFAYCLSGEILYLIEEIEYPMRAGDSIVFPAQLPHRWENTYEGESQMIIVFTPVSQNPEQSKTHFQNDEGA
jgi:transcriptional regulator with XRE-family HTH domain